MSRAALVATAADVSMPLPHRRPDQIKLVDADDVQLLAVFDAVRVAFPSLSEVEDLKERRDTAASLQCLLRKRDRSLAVQNRIALVVIGAEREIGERLGANPPTRGRPSKSSRRANISDVPFTPSDRHRFIKLAAISRDDLAALEQEATARGDELTRAYVVRHIEALTAGDGTKAAGGINHADNEVWRGRDADRRVYDAVNTVYRLGPAAPVAAAIAIVAQDRHYLTPHARAQFDAFVRSHADALAPLLAPEDA